MDYRIISKEEQDNPSYVQRDEDVWQSEGENPFFMYRNTAFHVVAKPDGGFISSLFDDYSSDPALVPLNKLTHETATVEDAVKVWVNVIRLAYLPATVSAN